MRKAAAWSIVMLMLGLPGACTTSIDAIGTGGAGDVGAVGSTIGHATTAFSVAAATGGSVYPPSPCGSFYDWDSCTVDTLDHLDVTTEQAGLTLVRTWRRCNEEVAGEFPVGVQFRGDQTVYNLYRSPNPSSGTENIVHCSYLAADKGYWELEENTGGGPADGKRLNVAWNDGSGFTLVVVMYDDDPPAFGLVHGELDDDQTERFVPEADKIDGSDP